MFPIRDNIPARHFPWVMTALIVLNSFVFILQSQLSLPHIEALMSSFGMVPARDFADVTDLPTFQRVLPFVSSLFLHGSFLHLAVNMWSLWLFGDNVEDQMGSFRFLLFYLACGLAASLTHAILHPGSMVPVVGASGAVSGVMGAYLLLFPHARLLIVTLLIFYPLVFEIPAVVFLLLWFLAQLFGGSSIFVDSAPGATEVVGGVAFWAHIGGFLAGMALMPLFRNRSRRFV